MDHAECVPAAELQKRDIYLPIQRSQAPPQKYDCEVLLRCVAERYIVGRTNSRFICTVAFSSPSRSAYY